MHTPQYPLFLTNVTYRRAACPQVAFFRYPYTGNDNRKGAGPDSGPAYCTQKHPPYHARPEPGRAPKIPYAYAVGPCLRHGDFARTSGGGRGAGYTAPEPGAAPRLTIVICALCIAFCIDCMGDKTKKDRFIKIFSLSLQRKYLNRTPVKMETHSPRGISQPTPADSLLLDNE